MHDGGLDRGFRYIGLVGSEMDILRVGCYLWMERED